MNRNDAHVLFMSALGFVILTSASRNLHIHKDHSLFRNVHLRGGRVASPFSLQVLSFVAQASP